MLITSWGAAQAFRNAIRDLTIDVGKGNAGAVALDFFANNQGVVDNVKLISSDPNRLGAVGLRIRGHNGPLLIKNLEVFGFDVGIWSMPDESATFEHITLRQQRKIGFHADWRNFIRKLRSENDVTALRASGSLTVLLDAELNGIGKQSISIPAITASGFMFIRDAVSEKYATILEYDKSPCLSGELRIREWTSHAPVALDAPVTTSLNLNIEESPTVEWGSLSGFASVADYKPVKITINVNGKTQDVMDWTPAVQAAIDSGAHTVYFPVNGNFHMYGKVFVRGNVRRIIGLERPLEPGPLRALFCDPNQPRPRFIIENGSAPVVVIERFDSIYGCVQIVHRSKRTLVVRNMATQDIIAEPGAGDLFLDDTIPGYVTRHGGRLFTRQMNIEVGLRDGFTPRERFAVEILDGATAWIFGMKTEQSRGKISVKDDSKCEVYAYIYSHTDNNPFPMFQIENADFTATVTEKILRNAPHIAVVRRKLPKGQIIDFKRPNTTLPLVTVVRNVVK